MTVAKRDRLPNYLKGKFVVAGTGSRSFDEEKHVETAGRLFEQMAGSQDKHGDNLVIMSGGATGWDHAIADMAFQLYIPYVLCIPNKGYGEYYWASDMDAWNFMCGNSAHIEYTMEDVHNSRSLYLNGVHSNFVRNTRMAELAHAFLVFDAGSRGTQHCVAEIKRLNKPYRAL